MSNETEEQIFSAAENSALSAQLPGLQLAWDSTSLGELKLCPRRYFYRILCGWTPRELNVHFKFGLGFHGATERYDHARANGADHKEALRVAVKWVMEYTWDKKMGRPWLSDLPEKNRLTLVRTVVWYYDKYEHDPIETMQLVNGKPAVELSIMLPLPYRAETGEELLYGGHLDKVGRLNDQSYIVDKKTTKSMLSESYFHQFSPDNQFSGYIFLGTAGFGLDIKGLIADAAQVGVTFSRFGRQLISRTPDQIKEWVRDLAFWLRQAEFYAKQQYWPMNDKACHVYGGCPFRQICAKAPSTRAGWLKGAFTKQMWNPLISRGDI